MSTRVGDLRSRTLIVAVALGLLVDAVLWLVSDDSLAGHLETMRSTGWTAIAGLSLALAMSPLARATGRDLGALRRGFGVAAAVAGAAHAAIVLSGPWIDDVTFLLYEPQYRAGATTLAILSILAMTSFSPVLRVLRLKHWRDLHFLAYVAMLSSVHHVALSSHASVWWLIGIGAVASLLLAVRGPLRLLRGR